MRHGVIITVVAVAAIAAGCCCGCAAKDSGGLVAHTETDLSARLDRLEANVTETIRTSTSQAVDATNKVGGNLRQEIVTRSTTTTGLTGTDIALIIGAGGLALIGLVAVRSWIVKHGYTPRNWQAKAQTVSKTPQISQIAQRREEEKTSVKSA